jgi:hypothetical protein
MADFPRSLPEFERRFPDEAACAEWLLEHRWGRGFACPGCGHDGYWRLGRKVLTLQCRACRRETAVTAGTVLHRSHLPLKVWFTAAWLVATHKNGMSARQLWLQLGLGSYKSAWLLLRKLRAGRWSTRTAGRSRAWWRWTRPAYPFAPRATRSGPDGRTTASC